MLGLDHDRQTILNSLAKDKLLNPLISHYRGLTIMHQDPYECLISFMTSTVSNIPRIMLNLRNLRINSNSLINGTLEYSFPTAKHITRLGESKLRKLGFGYRSKYIALTCNEIINRTIDFDLWKKKTDAELTSALMDFPGVGRKIAECVALFGFNRRTSFPVDVWVKRALYKLKPKLNNMTSEELCKWGKERWGENAGMAQQILFCGARNSLIPH